MLMLIQLIFSISHPIGKKSNHRVGISV